MEDEALSSRASVFVVLGDVDEVELAEAPLGLAVGGHRLGHVGRDAGLLARQDLRTLEVAAIGDHSQLLVANRFAGLLRHRPQLGSIVADVDDVVRNDQVVLGIGDDLDVVADDAGASATGGHGAGVGIGQGELLVRLLEQLGLDAAELAHLLA